MLFPQGFLRVRHR